MSPASLVGSTWESSGRSLLWDLGAEGPRGVGFSWQETSGWGPVWQTKPHGDTSWKQERLWVCTQAKSTAHGSR